MQYYTANYTWYHHQFYNVISSSTKYYSCGSHCICTRTPPILGEDRSSFTDQKNSSMTIDPVVEWRAPAVSKRWLSITAIHFIGKVSARQAEDHCHMFFEYEKSTTRKSELFHSGQRPANVVICKRLLPEGRHSRREADD